MMESLTLRAALRECAALSGKSVSAVRASPDESAITIHFAPLNDGIVLDMSAGRPGVYRTGPPEGGPAGLKRGAAGEGGRMTALAALAEEKLRGARGLSFDQLGLDRVAILRFARRDRLGDPLPLTVVVELFGAWGNIILLDGDPASGKILDRLRLDNRRDGPRALGRGRAYDPPPPSRVDIVRDGDETLRARLAESPRPESPKEWAARLGSCAEGMSPFTAEEVVHRAGVPLSAETLALSWRTFVDEAEAAGPAYLRKSSTGAVRILTYEPRSEAADIQRFPDVSAACAAARAAPPPSPAGDPRRDLEDHLRKRHAEAVRLLGRLKAEKERRSDGPADRRRAEALLAYATRVPRGAETVTLPDPHGGADLTIVLDPSRTVMENAERFFREARKAEQAEVRLPKKIAAAKQSIGRIELLAEKVKAADAGDDRALKRLGEEVYGRRRPGSRRPGEPGAEAPDDRPKPDGLPASLRPRRYEMPGGWVILVGRSNTGNDYLTHRLAAPHDLWFHAHGAAGSHVVLKAPNRRIEPDREIITAAAALAALHSKARHSSRVPVIYAEIRHVRKPRGGKPGLAMVTHEKSVMVKPAEPRVESRE